MPISGSGAWSVAVTDRVCSFCSSRSKLRVVVMTPEDTDTSCLRATASGLSLQRGTTTAPLQERATTSHSTTVKLNPRQPCKAQSQQDQPHVLSLLLYLLDTSSSQQVSLLLPPKGLQPELLAISLPSLLIKTSHRAAPVIVRVTEYFKASSRLLWNLN